MNDSHPNGTFPDDWKLARVTPVYKNNGDVNTMSNYRPISVIGYIAKMVEELVRSQLVSYLEEHAFISPDQSAYLKGYSTQTSLHPMIDDWLENINDNQTAGVCLLDISKCFDTINHHILLGKLGMYDIKKTKKKPKKNRNLNGFLPICTSANKLYCAIIRFQVRLLTSLILCRKGQCWDHFYSYFSLMIYRILRPMAVWRICLPMTPWSMPQGIMSLKCNSNYKTV